MRRERDGVAADKAEKDQEEKDARHTLEEGVEEWTADNVGVLGNELIAMSMSADEKRAVVRRQWMFQKGWSEKAKKTMGAMPPAKGSVSVWVAKLQEKLQDSTLQNAIKKVRAEANQVIPDMPPLDINLGAIPSQPLIPSEVLKKRGAEVIAKAKHEDRCTKHKLKRRITETRASGSSLQKNSTYGLTCM